MPFGSSGNRRTPYTALIAIAALSAITAVPLLASAPGPGTVQVGKETKKTVGIVTEVQAGDVACYLTLKDEKGAVFQELADFEICEKPGLVGKRVTLTYTLGNVMADECQGNPDCSKTRKVALVSAVRVMDGKAAPKPAASRAPSQVSFCAPRETVVFACRVGAKLVSVCASEDASPTRGSLQYRFGKADSREPLEIALPETPAIPPKAASGQSEPFAGGGGSWLRFHQAPFAYVVYSGIGRWGPHGETREKQGIVVERAGKTVAHLKCGGDLTGLLGPDWFERVGIQANDEEFLFPD